MRIKRLSTKKNCTGQRRSIICLVFIGGRVGSSLVMGLLKKSGINVGTIGTAADVNNPNGYFEIGEMIEHVHTHIYPQLGGFMPYPVEMSDADIHKHLTPQNILTFEKLFFGKWFKRGNRQLALKVGFLYPVKLFQKIAKRHGYQLITISLNRQPCHVAQSIQKLNTSSRTPTQWLSWQNHWRRIKDEHNYEHSIDFDDWFAQPYKTYLKLYNMCQPPIKLTEQQVLQFIDPSFKHF